MSDVFCDCTVNECAHQGGEDQKDQRPENTTGQRRCSIDTSNSMRRRIEKPMFNDVQRTLLCFRLLIQRRHSLVEVNVFVYFSSIVLFWEKNGRRSEHFSPSF